MLPSIIKIELHTRFVLRENLLLVQVLQWVFLAVSLTLVLMRGGSEGYSKACWYCLELTRCVSSQLLVYGPHIGSLKLAMVIAFTPQKLASTRGISCRELVVKHLPSYQWILLLLLGGSWCKVAGMTKGYFIKDWQGTAINTKLTKLSKLGIKARTLPGFFLLSLRTATSGIVSSWLPSYLHA